MTGNKWKKRAATAALCLGLIAAEAVVWEKFVTTTLYGQARAMPEETQATEEVTQARQSEEAETPPETQAPDPKEEVWNHYEHLGVIRAEGGYADIYASPDSYSVSIGKALTGYGFEMDPAESNATWTKVESGECVGYIRSESVATGEEARAMALSYCVNGVIPQTEQLPCYQEASADAAVMLTLPKGERYELVEDAGEWVKIRIRDGVEGYVEKSQTLCGYYLQTPVFYERSQEISDARRDVINEAWKYYGGAYVWGGEVLGEGVDCSGFVLRLYEQFGVNLHRVSAEQATDGVEVSLAQMRPGDLIFYHGYRDGGVTEGVGHVAIYMGNGKIIHAASEEKGICMDNWDYIPYITVRNVFGD